MPSRTATHDLKLRVATSEGSEIYDLSGEVITGGRGADNNVVIRDACASRSHFKIEQRDGRWSVVDLGSQNGTFLNGRRVRRRSLRVGDVVQVGGVRITIEKKVPADSSFTERGTTSWSVQDGAPPSGETDSSLHAETISHLQDVARSLNSELDVGGLLNLIIDHAVELSGAQRGFLIMMGRRETEVRVARDFERRDVGSPESAVSWSIVTSVSSSGQGVVCVDARDDDRFAANESVPGLGLRSVMCVPLKVKRRVTGVIYLDNRLHKGVFDHSHLTVLEMLSDHAAIALGNARLHDELLEQERLLEGMNSRLKTRDEAEARGGRGRVAQVSSHAAADAGASIIGESAAIRRVISLVNKVAESDIPVLITGESGTGKEVVARAIHALSRRSGRRMVSENCCAIPETLLESELFGHCRGAFTGATADRAGLFEAASKGTLFLDEIGDMELSLQSKLLRVLQEGEIRPLGSSSPVSVDVRLITATNQDLPELISTGKFRKDLFYRIKVVSIRVPPLRQRREDIPLFVNHFLARFAEQSLQKVKTITPDALEMLQSHPWPGNVRELENEVNAMCSLGGASLGVEDVSVHIREQPGLGVGTGSSPEFRNLKELVEAVETREIMRAMAETGTNKTRASKLLGISRFALQRKLDKYKLEVPADS